MSRFLRAAATPFLFAALISFLALYSPPEAFPQRADHLTNEEIELIRDVQAVDDRMEIFTRAIERRLIALNGTAGLSKDELKKLEKEADKWGELPQNDPSQIFQDIRGILDEAISKIEDVADRNEESALFPFAVYILSDYCSELIPRLETLKSKASTPRSVAMLNDAIEQSRDIIAASAKVERPDPENRKKAKKEAAKRSTS